MLRLAPQHFFIALVRTRSEATTKKSPEHSGGVSPGTYPLSLISYRSGAQRLCCRAELKTLRAFRGTRLPWTISPQGLQGLATIRSMW